MGENNECEVGSIRGSRFWENTPGLAECFLELCADEVRREGLSGSSLKTVSWKNLGEGINKAFGYKLEQKCLKNRFDLEKKRFNLWKEVTRGTDGGINFITGEINWDERRWAQAMKNNPKAKVFKGHPLKNCELLYKVYGAVSTKGAHRHAFSQDGMPPEGDEVLEKDKVEETPSVTISEDMDSDGDQPETPSQQQAQPTNESTSVMPSGSSCGSKKRKKRNGDNNDIATVIKLLECQFAFIKEELEVKRTKELAQKHKEESCSITECIGVLKTLKGSNMINDGHYSLALVQLAKEEEFRFALMEMEKLDDQQTFVKALAMIQPKVLRVSFFFALFV